ncbi:hypothetical protein Pmar_PMAR013711 [Perkinsus marinus ATCC 50983]|uniref:Uncharacterized protein n=1 Tax=Perkinsus marinus (strain ATCC 50983 / TXsc) TaxID=423536 RepID=C5LY32_PERM5|nr:hypothetical protein Pmar_PMAR013711 [Perkinsus marinus ATCC 50983]EEQ98362.1 hypothetical protein Pmar_PMAR013711 [Perkinsus marinus ATCC 50983]|eukprot:XP_002765645.1 hypothetical protein Pmar_PMAR013711 [Perkinsus marinus ATCC 50983]
MQLFNMGMRSIVNILLITVVVANNACNDKDKEKLTNNLFPNYLYKCASDAKLTPSKIAPCLEKGCGLSHECADCFVAVGACTIKSCITSCMFSPLGKKCQACAEEHCGAELKTCTGLAHPLPNPTKKGDKCY